MVLYDGRNYDLFAILADVRNGYGNEPKRFTPICPPKGLPGNLSNSIKQIADDWGADAHSHSWFTLKELLDFDWTQVGRKVGVVSAEQYFQWNGYQRELGFGPKSYCGGISGGGIRMVSEDEMEKSIKLLNQEVGVPHYRMTEQAIEKHLKGQYCKVEWETPYCRSASDFLSEVIPYLLQMGRPDEVRIVFWFDN